MRIKFHYGLSLIFLFTSYFASCKKHKPTFRVICKHINGVVTEESEISSYEKDMLLVAQLKVNGKFIKEVTLSEGYRPIIPLFVKELDTLPQQPKCTIVDSYTVYIDNKTMKRIDGTCQWYGFERLEYAWFSDSLTK